MTVAVQRPPPRNKFEFFERGWRVVLAWICIVFVIVPLCLCAAALMIMFTYGVLNSIITGTPMPDLTAGFDRVLPSIMPYVAPAIGALFTLLLSRHREVNTQLGNAPFAPPSPQPSPSAELPSGGLINNEAIS